MIIYPFPVGSTPGFSNCFIFFRVNNFFFKFFFTDQDNLFTMDSSCATVVNSITDLKQWSSYSGSRSYPCYDNFNNFDSFGETCAQTLIRAPIMPINSFQPTNESDFQTSFGDYAVSSSRADIKVENIDAKDIDTKNLVTFFKGMTDTSTDDYSEDTWSNAATSTPDTLTYSSSEEIHSDDSHVAQKSAPILRQRLTDTAGDLGMNSSYWQDYQQSHVPSQQIPLKPSLPGHFQQHSQFQRISQQFPQHSQFSECCQFPQYQFQQHNQIQQNTQIPQYSQMQHHSQIQQSNQFQQHNQQKPCQYAANTNYIVPMLPGYQAMHQQEVGLRMGGMVSPVVSVPGPSPPMAMPVSSTTAASPPIQIGNTGGSILVLASRKKAVSRTKTNRSLPSNKDGENTIYHKCPLCFRPFKNKSNIKTHIRTHTKEKPYVCEICNKAFCQKAHLRKHVFTHQKQKN